MAEPNFICAICLDFTSEYPNKDYFVSTKGGHIFHFLCIKQHVGNGENTCPLCREPVALDQLTRLYGIKIKQSALTLRLQSDGSDGTLPSIKIVILGNSCVGKSSILRRFANKQFIEDINATCGVDVVFRNIAVSGKLFRLNLWDTAGQENFRSVVSTTVRGASGIILVYDVTDTVSINDIEGWLRFANDNGPENSTKILIGNKCDLEENRRVATFVGQAVADKLGLTFFETSAKSGENIEAVIRTLVAKILEKPIFSQNQTNIVELEVESSTSQHKGCRC